MINKQIREAIPTLLIHFSIGTIFCWSTFEEVKNIQINKSTFAVGWIFF